MDQARFDKRRPSTRRTLRDHLQPTFSDAGSTRRYNTGSISAEAAAKRRSRAASPAATERWSGRGCKVIEDQRGDRIEERPREWRFDLPAGWNAFHRAFFDEVGLPAYDYMYQVGLRFGDEMAHPLVAAEGGRPISFFRVGLAEMAERGFGRYELGESTQPETVCVHGRGSLEAWSAKQSRERTKQPVCRLVCGVLAGIWNHALGSARLRADNVVCWETTCMAAGAECCRFELGPAEILKARGVIPNNSDDAVRWQLQALVRNLDQSRQQITTLDHELRKRITAFESLLEHMGDMLVVVDHNKRVAFCNRRYLELIGRELPDVIGCSPLEWIDSQDRKGVEAAYDALLSGAVLTATYQFRMEGKGGTRFFESSARALPGQEGLPALEAIARDVTEREVVRQRLETALLDAIRRQQAADRDLRTAKLVHESLLPGPESRPEVEVDVQYLPVERVGGDYCHLSFSQAGNRKWCQVTVCDVSGHGTAAALLAARVDSQIRLFSQTRGAVEPDPLALTRALNRFLRKYFADTGMFVTAFSLTLDLDSLQMKYCGAGHPGALLQHAADQQIETLPSQNLPLGVLDDFELDGGAAERSLTPGDRLLLYTDGVTDVVDGEGSQFGASGLTAAFQRLGETPFFEVAPRLLEQVKHVSAGRLPDDICMVLLQPRRIV